MPFATTVRITALAVATAVAVSVPAGPVAARPQAGPRPQFDLEGHRGSRGLRPENTLAAFTKALQVGVSTLELDTGVTGDGHVLVDHDRLVNPAICDDTAPAFPGDAEFPYAGSTLRSLTLAQLTTLDCKVIEVVDAHGVAERSDIQSFDWRTLVEARRIRPRLRLVALAQKPTIFPGTPWTAIATRCWGPVHLPVEEAKPALSTFSGVRMCGRPPRDRRNPHAPR